MKRLFLKTVVINHEAVKLAANVYTVIALVASLTFQKCSYLSREQFIKKEIVRVIYMEFLFLGLTKPED